MINSLLQKNNKKIKLLIFGTGAGGNHAFQVLSKNYNLVGFLDNNVAKHGTNFHSKRIYNPAEIEFLNFDKIIIASDYYKDILGQLTNELNINEDTIDIFHSAAHSAPNFRAILKQKFRLKIFKIICNNHYLFAKLIISCNSYYFNFFKLKKIIWLDELKENVVCTFRNEKDIVVSSPSFLNKQAANKTIKCPSVRAYKFNKGTISTSSSFIHLGNQIIMSRVPSADIKKSDYSSGDLIYHGATRALIKKSKADKITKGIAITGSSDTNYYHWMLEVLSKTEYINSLPCEYDDFPILISEQAKKLPAISSFIKCIGIKREIIYLKSTNVYEVDALIFITSPNYLVANLKGRSYFSTLDNYIRHDSIQYLRKTGYSAIEDHHQLNYPKRIFLARKQYIRSYNQNQVEHLLKQYKFSSVYLEDLALREQVILMSQAEYIVGPTGAAWTNLLFTNKNVKALCWMAEEYGDLTCFSSIAQQLEIDLEFLTYKNNANSTRETYYHSYSVDIRKIQSWLIEHIN